MYKQMYNYNLDDFFFYSVHSKNLQFVTNLHLHNLQIIYYSVHCKLLRNLSFAIWTKCVTFTTSKDVFYRAHCKHLQNL